MPFLVQTPASVAQYSHIADLRLLSGTKVIMRTGGGSDARSIQNLCSLAQWRSTASGAASLVAQVWKVTAGTSLKVRLDTVTQPRSSIPDGLIVELSRAKVLPGASAEADRWMEMLNDRLDECVATLDRERMAIEIIFRLKENGEDYLFWMSVRGADGAGLDPDNALDRDHMEQANRTIEPGRWTEAAPQVLLLPDPVREAVLSWALRGRGVSQGPSPSEGGNEV